ncbi:branched-chain amino acid ABC transporter substrate-binding protein [Terasakiella brassicae]|uniref:Branched-chain amino acid ABC transporter substrate-binding protein n=1 Tax=Terasakiella brassicae TaxID=1634917 RepID=A0A917F7V4_9PROT|nr:ABC transporter substrate-binding protein [Terasakiella brassicae]GGF54183.1 branched-chain amino acid ABC transporter substrate-binding protein [Terasakiella brassicae]
MRKLLSGLLATTTAVAFAGSALAADKVLIANLADLTGPTASVSKPFTQGKQDAAAYLNKHGGIAGMEIDLDTVDYAYAAPRAIAQYKSWKSAGVKVIQGWGTADTEALVGFVSRDKIPYYSASYSAHLQDPTGKSEHVKKGAPYNFFAGPSYSDGARAVIQWAAADAKEKGIAKPKFVYMGDNHPYPNAAKKAAKGYAEELGFEVGNDIIYSMKPGDFKAQCLTLKESGANYAYLANTGGSGIALLKACKSVGAGVQFVTNVWGMDENVMKAAGAAADGVVFPMGAAAYGADVPGMKLVKEINAAGSNEEHHPVHYMRGVCSFFYMKEAMEWAAKNGGITGDNIKKGMYQTANWVPAGLEGVCPAGTWTAEDHRGHMDVYVYQANVKGEVDPSKSVPELLKDGTIGMTKLFDAKLERKPEWLGL